jgi:hypothetical protein
MEISDIASGLAAQSVTSGVNIGVLKAVQNLDQTQSALLFSSIGIGAGIDTYA